MPSQAQTYENPPAEIAALRQRVAELESELAQNSGLLQVRAEAAEAASHAKSSFLAGVSHELRNPLNAIIGYAQALKEGYFGELTDRQSVCIADVYDSSTHLLALINDVLDISRIESGKMELRLAPMHVAEALEDTLVLIREKALKHHVALSLDVPPDVRALTLQADALRLKQIMFNLLSNAAKFTPDGGAIVVSASIIRSPDAHNGRLPPGMMFPALAVSVTDTGIGVAESQRKTIFEEFFQAQDSLTDKTPGTGLGLALSKRLVKLHGGTIWVESEGPGRGSCFSFVLPLARRQQDFMPSAMDGSSDD